MMFCLQHDSSNEFMFLDGRVGLSRGEVNDTGSIRDVDMGLAWPHGWEQWYGQLGRMLDPETSESLLSKFGHLNWDSALWGFIECTIYVKFDSHTTQPERNTISN